MALAADLCATREIVMTAVAHKWEPRIAARYKKTFDALQTKCPAFVEEARWLQCVRDGGRFLAQWGERAQGMNWSSADLFGLVEVPERPSSRFDRLSRYDRMGLCWLLQGRCVTVLSEATAMIGNVATGTTTLFRKNNRPALGPVGDSLEDLK